MSPLSILKKYSKVKSVLVKINEGEFGENV